MSARLIDGTAIAASVRAEAAQTAALCLAAGRRPGLAVILMGDSAASRIYVRNKVRACEQAGIHSMSDELPADLPEGALLARIAALNADPAIDGILVQLPLPSHVDSRKVIEAIAAGLPVVITPEVNAGLPAEERRRRAYRADLGALSWPNRLQPIVDLVQTVAADGRHPAVS